MLRSILAIAYTIGFLFMTTVAYGDFSKVDINKPKGALTEIPPEILSVPSGKALSYYLTTDRTYRCDVLPDQDALGVVDCDYLNSFQMGPDRNQIHRHSYYGAFSAENVRSKYGGIWRITANHGENKNEATANGLIQNTWFPAIKAEDCYSGVKPGDYVYRDCWEAYAGFIGVSRSPGSTNNRPEDTGPAIWPAYGYVSADGKYAASHGVQHPTIVKGYDGYVYMTYYDTGWGKEGRHKGFRVARSKQTDLGRNWHVWVQKRHQWLPALPAATGGKRLIASNLRRKSPSWESEPLFESSSAVLVIARTTDRRFVSIEQGHDFSRPCVNEHGQASQMSRTRIRLSRDAVHWSKPIELHGADFDGCDFYPNSRMTYAKFMNNAGTSTKLINLDSFYLLGVRYGGQVWKVHMSLKENK